MWRRTAASTSQVLSLLSSYIAGVLQPELVCDARDWRQYCAISDGVLQWRAPRLFKWFLLRSGVLLSLVSACQCPRRKKGLRTWWTRLRSWRESMTLSTSLLKRVASYIRHQLQFQGSTSARSSLIYIGTFQNLIFCQSKPVPSITPFITSARVLQTAARITMVPSTM